MIYYDYTNWAKKQKGKTTQGLWWLFSDRTKGIS